MFFPSNARGIDSNASDVSNSMLNYTYGLQIQLELHMIGNRVRLSQSSYSLFNLDTSHIDHHLEWQTLYIFSKARFLCLKHFMFRSRFASKA